MTSRPRIAVVGGGLIGSAAARHLALAGLAPTLFAPDEPADKRRHRGVFGSHYDEGRITRQNDADPFWAEAAIAAIGRYSEIEQQSGISFYTERGALFAGPEGNAFTADCRKTAAGLGIVNRDLSPAEAAALFPYLAFPPGTDILFEPSRGGYLSPRRLVAAQREAARRAGARVLNIAASGVDETDGVARVRTADGAHDFDHVVVTAGLMTDHVLGRQAELKVFGRTVALLEIGEAEAARLAKMPPVLLDAPFADYILPPIRYPDGRTLLKVGGEPRDHPLTSPAEIGDWFRAGGNAEDRDAMAASLLDLIPSLAVVAVHMDACATSYTQGLRPEIRTLSDRLSVAAGGCGSSAKSSDEFGRRAAALAKAAVAGHTAA